MEDIILIKRYSNRKLYDTARSKYITLTELGNLVLDGKNIRVLDNETKEDITEITITQILIAQQKQRQHGIRKLVQTQAEVLLQRISIPVQQIRDEALRQAEILKRKLPPEISKIIPDVPSPESFNNHEDSSEVTQNSQSIIEEKALERLKTTSDDELLSTLLLHRVSELEERVQALMARIQILESSVERLKSESSLGCADS